MKEGIEKIKIKAEDILKKAQGEITSIINLEKERRDKNEEFDPRWVNIDPKQLTPDDLGMFQKYRDGSWSKPQWDTYTDKVTEELEERNNNSRDVFRDILAEKAQISFGKQENIQ